MNVNKTRGCNKLILALKIKGYLNGKETILKFEN